MKHFFIKVDLEDPSGHVGRTYSSPARSSSYR